MILTVLNPLPKVAHEPSSEVGSYRSTKKNGEMNKMPKYMAIHTLPEPMENEAVVPLAKKVRANCTYDAYWVGTQVQLNDEGKVLRFICEWNAKNPDAVKKVFAKVPELPYDGIYPMTKLDSEDFL